MLVATFIAPGAQPLTEAFVDGMSSGLTAQGITVAKTQWLKPGIACDLYFPSPPWGRGQGEGVVAMEDNPNPNPLPKREREYLEYVDGVLQKMVGGQPVDVIVQKVTGRKKKLLVADMESTIITIEALDELAEFVGLKEKIAGITARAMNGELDFESALRERVGLLKGLPESTLQQVADERMQLMPGAKELVSTMRANGAHCILVSGGFSFFTTLVRDMLGFDEDYSNQLEIKDGVLTGNVMSPILGKEAKLTTLKNTCIRLGIDVSESLAVGDGANDLPMLMEAGLGVAYHAKPAVRAAAKARVNHADLTALLFAQGINS